MLDNNTFWYFPMNTIFMRKIRKRSLHCIHDFFMRWLALQNTSILLRLKYIQAQLREKRKILRYNMKGVLVSFNVIVWILCMKMSECTKKLKVFGWRGLGRCEKLAGFSAFRSSARKMVVTGVTLASLFNVVRRYNNTLKAIRKALMY